MGMFTDDRTAIATAGDDFISVTRQGVDHEGRTTYSWGVATGDYGTHEGADLSTGVGIDPGPLAMLATLCSFLGAAAEAYRYGLDGHTSDNSDLFPPEVNEWAHLHDDELTTIRFEIEEGES